MNSEDLILKLFNERPLADVIFVVEEQEIRVHKAFLGSNCAHFYIMLFESTKEASATRIALNETPLKQFEEVIRFCYLKKVKIGGWGIDEVCKLLSLAHEYNYDILLEAIGKEMHNQSMINSVSLPVFYDLAVKLSLEQVLKAIQGDVRSSILQSEEFLEYSADLVCFIVDIVPRTALSSLWKWKARHTDGEVEQVFKKYAWEKLSGKQLGEVIRALITQVKLSDVSELTDIDAHRRDATRSAAHLDGEPQWATRGDEFGAARM